MDLGWKLLIPLALGWLLLVAALRVARRRAAADPVVAVAGGRARRAPSLLSSAVDVAHARPPRASRELDRARTID